MPPKEPGRKPLPNSRPALPATASGGNQQLAMPSSTVTSTPTGRSETGDTADRGSASRQQPSMTSSDGGNKNVDDEVVVVSATHANPSNSTPDSHKKSQAPKGNQTPDPSPSRKRDHDHMANASGHSNNAGARIGSQASEAHQAYTNDAPSQPTKYQRVLPRVLDQGVVQGFPAGGPNLAPDGSYESYMQHREWQEASGGLQNLGIPFQSIINKVVPGNATTPHQLHRVNQLVAEPSNSSFPGGPGNMNQKEIRDMYNPPQQFNMTNTSANHPECFLASNAGIAGGFVGQNNVQPGVQQPNNTAKNPFKNPGNIRPGRKDASPPKPVMQASVLRPTQDPADVLLFHVNQFVAASINHEKLRLEQSEQLYSLFSQQADAHTCHIEAHRRQIVAFDQALHDFQASFTRADASRDWELNTLNLLLFNLHQELAKKRDQAAGRSQQRPAGPDSDV